MTDPGQGLFQQDRTANKGKMFVPMKCRAAIWGVLLFAWLPSLFAQVSPAEIKDPRLKELQQTYLEPLIALNRTISGITFPFKFSLNRQVGLDPKDQAGADARGLEFVNFHGREVLKFSGNYNAAFNAGSLTPNQRAARVLNEVILPMLQLLPEHFNPASSFDAFGFEIGYHVLHSKSSYQYEGKEILVLVLDKSDGLRYAALREDALRQEILNRSDIFLNGSPFGLALNAAAPFEIEALVRRPSAKIIPTNDRSRQQAASSTENTAAPPAPSTPPSSALKTYSADAGMLPSATNIDLEALQKKYQTELENLKKEGVAKYHFADYAPVSFVNFRNRPALQATLRNPEAFDKDASSIYKRAARTFDLFLAPKLKGILENIPENSDFDVLDFTVILELTSGSSPKSSEAVEFFLPLKPARRLAAADITNQDLINESIVLVNGVRITLNLPQVE